MADQDDEVRELYPPVKFEVTVDDLNPRGGAFVAPSSMVSEGDPRAVRAVPKTAGPGAQGAPESPIRAGDGLSPIERAQRALGGQGRHPDTSVTQALSEVPAVAPEPIRIAPAVAPERPVMRRPAEDPRVNQVRRDALEQGQKIAAATPPPAPMRTEPSTGAPPSAADYFRLDVAEELARQNR